MPVHPRKLYKNNYITIIHNQIDNYYSVYEFQISVCKIFIDDYTV